MEVAGFMPLVRRWWLVLIAAGLLAGGSAFLLASRAAPTYEAHVALVTGPINTDYTTLRAAGELARTYSELAVSGPVLRKAADEAGVDGTFAELRESVIASANEVTRIVSVRVRDHDRARARDFAASIASRLVDLSNRVAPQDTEAIEELMLQREVETLAEGEREAVRRAAVRVFGTPAAGRLTVVDSATVADEPVAPPVSLITVLATLGGVLLAGVFALVRERSADAVASEDELAEIAAAPVLASLNGLRPTGDGPLVVAAGGDARAAEPYRVLAAKLGLADGEPRRSFLVVAADVGDGTGLLAANLAAAFAETDRRVTLLDANTSDGEITGAFRLDDRPGYTQLLADRDAAVNGAVDEAKVEVGVDLSVIPRGAGGDAGVIEIDRAQRLLARLLEDTDVLVVSAPPIERSPSALVWARLVDATVLVARPNGTRRDNLTDAVRTLELVDGNLVGTVVAEKSRRWRAKRSR